MANVRVGMQRNEDTDELNLGVHGLDDAIVLWEKAAADESVIVCTFSSERGTEHLTVFRDERSPTFHIDMEGSRPSKFLGLIPTTEYLSGRRRGVDASAVSEVIVKLASTEPEGWCAWLKSLPRFGYTPTVL